MVMSSARRSGYCGFGLCVVLACTARWRTKLAVAVCELVMTATAKRTGPCQAKQAYRRQVQGCRCRGACFDSSQHWGGGQWPVFSRAGTPVLGDRAAIRCHSAIRRLQALPSSQPRERRERAASGLAHFEGLRLLRSRAPWAYVFFTLCQL